MFVSPRLFSVFWKPKEIMKRLIVSPAQSLETSFSVNKFEFC